MNSYKELCETLWLANSWQFAPKFVNAMLEAADAIERLTYERHLIQQSIERYDNNWLMDGDDVVLKIREILEGE